MFIGNRICDLVFFNTLYWDVKKDWLILVISYYNWKILNRISLESFPFCDPLKPVKYSKNAFFDDFLFQNWVILENLHYIISILQASQTTILVHWPKRWAQTEMLTTAWLLKYLLKHLLLNSPEIYLLHFSTCHNWHRHLNDKLQSKIKKPMFYIMCIYTFLWKFSRKEEVDLNRVERRKKLKLTFLLLNNSITLHVYAIILCRKLNFFPKFFLNNK